MKILFGVFHPKHVYIFKNTISALIEKGHEIKIVAVDKDITEYLLKEFNMPSTIMGKNQPKFYKKLLCVPKLEYLTYKISKQFKPDIFVARASPYLAHVSTVLNKPFIVFEDTEIAGALHKITIPFADSVVTPECYTKNHGKKHTRFNGYFELAYLHPKYFDPNPNVLKEVGLNKNERFVIVRFVGWTANHDLNDKGFTDKSKLIMALEEYGRVFISSETKLPEEIEKYRLNLSHEKIHHLMYYADLLIGESATMCAESAILGTPAIFVSTSRRGYTDELESKYDLLYSFSDLHNAQENAIKKAIELLEDDNAKNIWQKKRENLLRDNVDVTKFMTEFIENFEPNI